MAVIVAQEAEKAVRVLVCMMRMVNQVLRVECINAIQSHANATEEQQPTDAQGSETFNLAKACREAIGWRSERPGDGRKSHKIRYKIGQGMKAICDQCLRMKDVTPDSFANGHSEIDKEANSCNLNASIVSIRRGQVGGVVCMTVAMTMSMSMSMSMSMACMLAFVKTRHNDGKGR